MANKDRHPSQKSAIQPVSKLVNTAKSKVRAVFARLGFHMLAFMAGGILSETVTAETYPHKMDDVRDGTGVLIYLSLVVIFPRRHQPVNTAVALLTALLWSFFGPWQLALAWGAVQRILLHIIDTKTLLHWRIIGTLALCALMFTGFFELNPVAYVPNAFLLGFGACTLLGIALKPLYARYQARKAAKIAKEIANQPISPLVTKAAILMAHGNLAEALSRQCATLPATLATPVAEICQHTQAIMHSMSTDPRDFDAGDKFLKRYLTIVEKIVTQNQKIAHAHPRTADIDSTMEKSAQLLQQLSDAFAQQQARLLENDMQDLTIELNVIDKLLKIEGYQK